jgi:hypothetical protein
MSAPARYEQAFQHVQCRDCHQPISFVKNKAGKWYPVDVFHIPNLGKGFWYKTGMGAFGNLTPWHKCVHRDEEAK